MDEEESKEDFVVVSVNLHENELTWMLVREPGRKGEVNLKIRQADMTKPEEVATVTIPKNDRFDFMLFGGFYLTAIRPTEFDEDSRSNSGRVGSKGKPGDAVIVLADSRDPDIRMFDKTEYKLIDFKNNTVSDFEVPSKKRGIEIA